MFKHSRLDTEIDKELQFHIDQQVDAYVAAGMSRADALRRARLEFGGVRQFAEDVHDVRRWRWLEDAVRDLQFAFRTYRKAPAFFLTSVVTLALGIGLNTALFSVVRQVLLKTLPVARPEELVEIDCRSGPGATGGGGSCLHSYPAFRLLSARHEGLSGVFAFSPVPNGLVASTRGSREVITAQLGSAGMFDLLGVAPAAGRLFVDDDDAPGAEPVALLSYGYWLRSFGESRDVIGQPLTINDRQVAIVGVLPRTYRGVTFGEPYDVVLPLGTADVFRTMAAPPVTRPSALSDPFRGWLTFLGRRRGDLSDAEIAKRLEPVFRQSVEAAIAAVSPPIREQLKLTADGVRVQVRPAAFGAASNLRRSLEPTLRVLTLVVALVLLIACANLAGLFLAQALNRRREFGLRLALGAGRWRLVRQVLTESVLLSAIGGGLGLVVALWVGPAGFSLATDETGLRAVDLGPDRWLLVFAAGVSSFAGLAIGVGSVLRASAANPQEGLRAGRAIGTPPLTKVILSAQLAFTITLVGSALLFLQTLTNYRRIDAGFRAERLLTVRMDPGFGTLERERALAYVARATEALGAIPGVESVTYSNAAMGTGVGMNLALDVPSFAGSGVDAASSGLAYVGPDFVRTVGLTLVSGSDFESKDRSDPHRAIVNESFATHFFGTTDIIGRSFAFRGPGNTPIRISGVVKDARDGGVKRPTQRIMYLPFDQQRTVTFTVRAANSVPAVSEVVRRTLARLDPAVGVERMRTIDAQFDDVLRRERLLAALGSVFGGFALLLMAVGLYGMLNAMIVRRTTEIGIRLALGAARHQVVWMLVRETLLVVALGLTPGLGGHLAVGRLVQNQLFGVKASDPIAVGGAVAALFLVAAAAVLLPARRALAIAPSEALRQMET